jgi:hypothetical protein
LKIKKNEFSNTCIFNEKKMSAIERVGEKVRFSLPICKWIAGEYRSVELFCPEDKFVYIITQDCPRVCLMSIYDGEITPLQEQEPLETDPAFIKFMKEVQKLQN